MNRIARLAVPGLFVCLCAAIPGRAGDQAARLQEDYRAAKEALRPHLEEVSLDDSAEGPALLDREWELIGDWVAEYLNQHSEASIDEIAAAIARLNPGLKGSAIRLGNKAYLVAAQTVPLGTFFIAAQAGAKFQVAWHVKDASDGEPGEPEGLSHWTPRGARCCALSVGRLGPLPPDAKGNARFWVEAVYSNGSTRRAQLSIWQWDGDDATPLLMKPYAFTVAAPDARTTFDGDALRIRTKENFKTFAASPDESGAAAEWGVRVTPQGVTDLGKRWLAPELIAIDELDYRVSRQTPAEDLAAPAVIAELKEGIPDVCDNRSVKNECASLGTLVDWKSSSPGPERTRLCLDVDPLPRYLFTIMRSGTVLFVTGIKDVSDPHYGENCAAVLAAPAAPENQATESSPDPAHPAP